MFESRFVVKAGGLEIANTSLSEGMYFNFDSVVYGYDVNLETDFDNVVNGSAYSGDEQSYMTGEVLFNDGDWNTGSTTEYAIEGDTYASLKNVIDTDGNGFVDNYVISEYDNNGVIEPIRDGVTSDVETRYASFQNFFKIHSYVPIKKDESLPNSPYSKIKLTCLLDNKHGDFKFNKVGLYVRKRTIIPQDQTNAFVDNSNTSLVGFNNNPTIKVDYEKTSESYNSFLQDPRYTGYNNFRNLLTDFTPSNVFSFDDDAIEDDLVLFAVLYMRVPLVKKRNKNSVGVVQNGFNKIPIDIDIDFNLLDEETRANLSQIISYQDVHRDWYTYLQMQNIKNVSNLQNHVIDLQTQVSSKSLGAVGNVGADLDQIHVVDTREELLLLIGDDYIGHFGYVNNDKQWYGFKSPTWKEIG